MSNRSECADKQEHMGLRQLTPGLAFLVLYLLAGAVLEPDGLALSIFGNLAIVSAAALALFSILRRRHDWVGCQRLFWDTIAAGMGIWLLGHFGWAYGELVERHPVWLEWHTVFSLSGGLGPLLALIARPHRGVRQHATAAVGVDIASYGLLAGFVYACFVLVPEAAAAGSPTGPLLVSVQVFRFALMAGMCTMAWIARETVWGPTYRRLAIGVTIGAVLRAFTSWAIASGEYHVGTLYDFAWIVPFMAIVWAVRCAPVSPEADDTPDRTSMFAFALTSAMPVLLIPVIGYSTLRLQALNPEAVAFRTLLTGLATVSGLGLLTLRLVVQRNELQRADVRSRLLAAATEGTGDLIVIARADGSIEHVNDAFLRAVDFSRREMSLLRFPQPLDHALAGPSDEIRAEIEKHGVWRGTLRRRRRDGSTFPASSTVVALRNSRRVITHFVAVERDVTDELRLRDQLVHSERLSAIGELVAGVAHEINNPLQAIVGCVELMLDDHADVSLMRRDLEIVRREAGRAGHIVQNLLSFVRRSAPNRIVADLNQLVTQTAELREYHLHQQNIRLIVQCTPEPLPVLVDREEIQQVVLNLLLNAEQALESPSTRGTIVVRTMNIEGRQSVEVLDNGPGIRPELRGRIFEPFFTTKEVGEGTGLGLSISHGIAAAHGGSLEIRDTPAGACFRLTLPPSETPLHAPPRGAVGGEETPLRVLVVDDEEPIRRLLARLLARRGYEVAEAETVGEAAAQVTSFEPGIVICDVRMPDGGGIALYRSLRSSAPEIARRFIFITGDLGSTQGSEPELAEVAVLAKPVTAADLDAILARLVPVRSR
jgi:PAS domain S-box-containing protein